jgi:hypothetical protein
MSIGVTEIDVRPGETALAGNAPFSQPSPPRWQTLRPLKGSRLASPHPKIRRIFIVSENSNALGRGVSRTSEWVRQERLD